MTLLPDMITVKAGSTGEIIADHNVNYIGDCSVFRVENVRIEGSNPAGITLAGGCFESYYTFFESDATGLSCNLVIDVPPGTNPGEYQLRLIATSGTENDYRETEEYLTVNVTEGE